MDLDKVTVSVVQMDIALGDPKKNRDKALRFVSEAGRRGSNVLAFPELCTTGYSLEHIHDLAEPINGKTITKLLDSCSKYGIYVIAPIPELRERKIYNSAIVLGPEGIVGSYSKVHLFAPWNEPKYFTLGDSCEVFQTRLGKIGLNICYDIRFPELARKLALNGAQILFVHAEWPYPRISQWETLVSARATENQIFVCASNRVGYDKERSFIGRSMVVDPMGNILVKAGDNEIMLTCELDMNSIDKSRNAIPCFKDRRPSIY